MRLLTCSLALLGAFVIPAWAVNPTTLRLEEAKLRATALRAKAKADVAKAKSQLSIPTPSPPKQRGKRQDFFVPDLDFQDGFQEEFDPTELIRLSKKKVLLDNAEHDLAPHFHPEQPFDLTSRDAQFQCLCKKLEYLNQDVDNTINIGRNSNPQELHHSQMLHNPGKLQIEVHGPGVPGVPGIVPVVDTSHFEKFHNIEFPSDDAPQLFIPHQGSLPEDLSQSVTINQNFREAEEPLIEQEQVLENERESHHHKRPHHGIIHHHQPHHQVFHNHHKGMHQHFGHPAHHKFRQAEENSTNPDETSIFDEFRDIDPIEPDFNDNKDQELRNFANEEFQSGFDDDQNQKDEENEGSESLILQNKQARDIQNIKGIIDGLRPLIDQQSSEKTKTEEKPGRDENKNDEKFETTTANVHDELREANHHHHHKVPHQHFGHPMHQKFRQAEENSTNPDETSIFDEFRDIDPIEPDFNDNKDQELRNFANEEFQSDFDDDQKQENEGFESLMLQSKQARDIQNIKGIIDGLRPLIDQQSSEKPKTEEKPGRDENKNDEKFETTTANVHDELREAHHHHHLKVPHQHFGHATSQEVFDQDFTQLEEPEVREAHLHHHTIIHNHRGLHHQGQVVVPGLGHISVHQTTGILPGIHQAGHQSFHHSGFQQEHQEGFQQSIGGHSQSSQLSIGGNQQGFHHNIGGHQQSSQLSIGGNQQGFQQNIGGHQQSSQQSIGGNQQGFHHNIGGHQQSSQQSIGGNQQGFQLNIGGHQQSSQQGIGGNQQGFQQNIGGHQQGFQQSIGGHQSAFQEQGFHQSSSGGHQSSFQQQSFQQAGLQPNTLIHTQNIDQRTNPQDIALDDIRSSQDDDTSSQVFDPFHEKDTTMDFLNRHQFDLPHPGFRNIEESSRHVEESAINGETSSNHAEGTVGNAEQLQEARTFDPRDIFGDPVFNILADLERQRNAEESFGHAEEARDAKAFDPSDLFSEDAFSNFMSDLGKQNQGRTDFIENMNDPHENMHNARNLEDEMHVVQRNENKEKQEVASPHLFNVPRNLDWQRKKRSMLDQILEKERHLVDSINNKTRNEDLNFIGHLGDRLLGDIERRRNLIQKIAAKTKELKPERPIDPRSRLDLNQIIMEHRLGQGKQKRSIPLMRMISDPKVKLDLPKTMENFGAATKNVFEDEKAPMYHVKHLLGSSRNAVLSAMKIPPQNIIIPSDYEIVKKDPEEVSSEEGFDERDPMGFAKTFKKVGNIVRNSILSSHETANHIGEIAQDVKNVLHTVRHAAPRLILPYSQIPAMHRPPHKAMLITPRILDLTQARESQPQEDHKLVKLGHLMDAVGISKPGESKLALDKIVFEPHYKRPPKPPSEKLVQLYSRFQDNTIDTVGEAVNALEDAKVSVGAKNLHDFLEKMRNALHGNLVRAAPVHHKHKSRRQKKDEEIDKFVETLFDDSKNDTVGAGLPLARELWQPFMGHATQTELKDFKAEPRRSSGHRTLHHKSSHIKHTPSSVNNETVGAFIEFLKSRDEGKTKRDDHENMKHLLGAINPMMFERIYNETLHVKHPSEAVVETKLEKEEEQRNQDRDNDGNVGNIMALSSAIKKPFMGQNPSAVKDFLNTYNGDMGEVEGNNDEDIQDPIIVDGDVMQD